MATTGLGEYIEKTSQNSQYLLIGDTNHFSKEIVKGKTLEEALFSDEILNSAKKSGFYKIGVEFNIGSQPLIDAFAKGEITKQQFVNHFTNVTNDKGNKNDIEKTFEIFANFISEAKKLGISVKAIDGNEGDYDAELQNEYSRRLSLKIVDACKNNSELVITPSYTNSMFNDVQKEMKQDGTTKALSYEGIKRKDRPLVAQGDGMGWRLTLDVPILAKRIHEIANGEPMAVIYGSWHMQKQQDIDEELARLHTIDLKNNPNLRPKATNTIIVHDSRESKITTDATLDSQCRLYDFNCAASPSHTNYFRLEQIAEPNLPNPATPPAQQIKM